MNVKRNAKIILYCNDDGGAGLAVSGLQKNGYSVLCCGTPAEVLEAVRRERADVVLLDLNMNEVQGAEVIREAKAINSEVSIILTGSEDDVRNNPHMLMSAGYECLPKPLGVELLKAVIEQRLNQQHLYRICSTITITRDIREILKTLLGLLTEEIGADNGVILLHPEPSEKLRIEAAQGLPEEIVGSDYLLDEHDVLSLVAANNEPIVLQGGFFRLPFLPNRVSREISSSICAPIRIGGKTLGLLSVNRMNASWPFSQSNLRTVKIAALQTAVAIQNYRAHQLALERHKLQQEMNLAHSIQQSLLPKAPRHEIRLDIGIKSIPAYFIGGDFYDFVELGKDAFGVAIGDVAGKGAPGALMMVRTLSSFRLRARPGCEPSTVLELLNNDLLENCVRGMYATVVYAIFDFSRWIVSFANAGHPPPLIRRANSIETLNTHAGIPLGILKDAPYRTGQFSIKPSDIFCSYTDGILEARDKNQQEFSLSRLKRALEESPAEAGECANHVLGEVGRFTAGLPQHDDLTLLTIKILRNGRT